MTETSTKRGKVNGYNSSKLWARREKLQIEAEKRQQKHDSLTVKQKIEKAVARGGSVRELRRLSKLDEK